MVREVATTELKQFVSECVSQKLFDEPAYYDAVRELAYRHGAECYTEALDMATWRHNKMHRMLEGTQLAWDDSKKEIDMLRRQVMMLKSELKYGCAK